MLATKNLTDIKLRGIITHVWYSFAFLLQQIQWLKNTNVTHKEYKFSWIVVIIQMS